MDRLKDNVAVVTAGGQPIGAGIAIRFAQEGAIVVVVDGDAVAGQATVKAAGGRAEFVQAAVDDKAQINAAIKSVGEKYGRIDTLVVGGQDAPGPERWAPFEAKTDADLAAALNQDVWGAFWSMQATFPHMKANGGSIICIFSPFGEYASQHVADHLAGRWGVIGLARSAAHEWGRHQIRVHTLTPLVDTPAYRAYRERDPKIVDGRVQDTAMKRMGDPVKDIGGAAVFLASDDTRYLTGQMVYADGGEVLTAPVFEPVWDA